MDWQGKRLRGGQAIDVVRGKERETKPDPVKGVGAGPGPSLLFGAHRGQGDKCPSLWGL